MKPPRSELLLGLAAAVFSMFCAVPAFDVSRSWIASEPINAKLEITYGLSVTGIRATLLDVADSQLDQFIIPVPYARSETLRIKFNAEISPEKNPLSGATAVHAVQLLQDGRPMSLDKLAGVESWESINQPSWSPFAALAGTSTLKSKLSADLQASEVGIMLLKSRASGKLMLSIGDTRETIDLYEPSDGTLWTYGLNPQARPTSIPFSITLPRKAEKLVFSAEPAGYVRIDALVLSNRTYQPMLSLGLERLGVSSIQVPLDKERSRADRRAFALTSLVVIIAFLGTGIFIAYGILRKVLLTIILSLTPTAALLFILEGGARVVDSIFPSIDRELHRADAERGEANLTDDIISKVRARATHDSRYSKLLSTPGYIDGFAKRVNHPAYRSKRWFSEDFLLSSIAQVGWYQQAGTNLILRQDSSDPFITVQNGVRVTTGWDTSLDPADGEIWVFGGSTTYCSEVPNELTWPSILQRLLVQRSIPWKVKNFGTTSIKASQELGRLAIELSKGNQPRAVIFYDGVNDIVQGVYRGNPHGTIYSSDRASFAAQKRSPANAILAFFKEHSTAMRRTIEILGTPEIQPLFPHLNDSEIRGRLVDETAQQWASVISEAHELTKKNSIHFLAFLQPHLSSHQQSSRAPKPNCTGEPIECALSSAHPDMQLASKTLQRNGVPVIDLSSALDSLDAQTTFLDHFHVVDTGNEIIAKNILDHLLQQWSSRLPYKTRSSDNTSADLSR
ncbi:MAG: SGNH/GDSL hydrolase family protein [Pseudomonadota bacterium]|jgi:lysophospholipase L1-like esterase